MRKRKSRTITNPLTNAIIDFFNFKGHKATRINTTGVFDPTRKAFRTGHRSAIGCGDIIICLKGGLYCEIEIKTGKDKQSENQLLRQKDIERAEGRYFVVKDIDNFLELAKKNNW